MGDSCCKRTIIIRYVIYKTARIKPTQNVLAYFSCLNGVNNPSYIEIKSFKKHFPGVLGLSNRCVTERV